MCYETDQFVTTKVT